MLETTYTVRLSDKLISLPKTWRDYQWEKMACLLSILQAPEYSASEKQIAKSLARTIRAQLERGYK